MIEQILHLYITTPCGHDCPLCCNKLYDIEKIPVVTVELLRSVQTVCLTGGDPMMVPPTCLAEFIIKLRTHYPNIENLYIYTSGGALYTFPKIINQIQGIYYANGKLRIDGINVAPKNWKDWKTFIDSVEKCWDFFEQHTTSNRLYLFQEQRPVFDAFGVGLPKTFQVIDRQWTKTFNTPDNEHFCRLPILM